MKTAIPVAAPAATRAAQGPGTIPGAAANAAGRVPACALAPGATGFPFARRGHHVPGLPGMALGSSMRTRAPWPSGRAQTSQSPALTPSARVVIASGPLPGTSRTASSRSNRPVPPAGTAPVRNPLNLTVASYGPPPSPGST
jgi:hypothetical protein